MYYLSTLNLLFIDSLGFIIRILIHMAIQKELLQVTLLFLNTREMSVRMRLLLNINNFYLKF